MKEVMFELSGTNFEKGVFELRLEKSYGGFLGWISGLGPVKGRAIALVFFLVAGFLLYFQIPAQALMHMHVVPYYPQAARIQGVFIWSIMLVGLALYALVLLLRRESLTLIFDRTKSQIRYEYKPKFSFTPLLETLAPLSDIESLKVVGPDKEPKTPYGFMEVSVPKLPEARLRMCQFKFLSDDQRRIYPLNLSKMVGVQPKGDWTDPDDQPLQTR